MNYLYILLPTLLLTPLYTVTTANNKKPLSLEQYTRIVLALGKRLRGSQTWKETEKKAEQGRF